MTLDLIISNDFTNVFIIIVIKIYKMIISYRKHVWERYDYVIIGSTFLIYVELFTITGRLRYQKNSYSFRNI